MTYKSLGPDDNPYLAAKYLTSVKGGLGFSPDHLRRAILGCPNILTYSVPALESRVEYLVGIGIPEDQLPDVIAIRPHVLVRAVESMEANRMTWLQEGLSNGEFIKIATKFPESLCKNLKTGKQMQLKIAHLRGVLKRNVPEELVKNPSYVNYSFNRTRFRTAFLEARGDDVESMSLHFVRVSPKDFCKKYGPEFYSVADLARCEKTFLKTGVIVL